MLKKQSLKRLLPLKPSPKKLLLLRKPQLKRPPRPPKKLKPNHPLRLLKPPLKKSWKRPPPRKLPLPRLKQLSSLPSLRSKKFNARTFACCTNKSNSITPDRFLFTKQSAEKSTFSFIEYFWQGKHFYLFHVSRLSFSVIGRDLFTWIKFHLKKTHSF